MTSARYQLPPAESVPQEHDGQTLRPDGDEQPLLRAAADARKPGNAALRPQIERSRMHTLSSSSGIELSPFRGAQVFNSALRDDGANSNAALKGAAREGSLGGFQKSGSMSLNTQYQEQARDAALTAEGSPAAMPPERKGKTRTLSVSRLYIMIILGISLGIILPFGVITNYSNNHTTAVSNSEGLTSSSEISVAVNGPLSRRSSELSVKAARPASNIIEHAQTRPVAVEPRRYMMAEGTNRSYQPLYVKRAPAPSNISKESIPAMKEIEGSSARYRSSASAVEWQSGWSYDDAEKNIRLGSAYNDYLDKALGDPLGRKLTSLNGESSNLLQQARPALPAPKR